MKFKVYDHVRINKFPESSTNARGKVDFIRGDLYYVSNLNMPYAGTISQFFTEEELSNV